MHLFICLSVRTSFVIANEIERSRHLVFDWLMNVNWKRSVSLLLLFILFVFYLFYTCREKGIYWQINQKANKCITTQNVKTYKRKAIKCGNWNSVLKCVNITQKEHVSRKWWMNRLTINTDEFLLTNSDSIKLMKRRQTRKGHRVPTLLRSSGFVLFNQRNVYIQL